MKIVMEYEIGGGYDCGSYRQVECFEYESAEAFLVDFEKACMDAAESYYSKHDHLEGLLDFTFCGYEFSWGDFYYKKEFDAPEVYELNEWFDIKKVGNQCGLNK